MGASSFEQVSLKRYQRASKKDPKLTVQSLSRDRPRIRREQHSNNPSIPEHTDKLERLAPAAETPLRCGESLRGAEQPTETNQTVGSGAGNTSGRNERGESHIRGEDGAGDQGCDAPDDDDCVAGLAVVYLGDPAGEWEHAVTSDGKDETGGGNDGDGGVLGLLGV